MTWIYGYYVHLHLWLILALTRVTNVYNVVILMKKADFILTLAGATSAFAEFYKSNKVQM